MVNRTILFILISILTLVSRSVFSETSAKKIEKILFKLDLSNKKLNSYENIYKVDIRGSFTKWKYNKSFEMHKKSARIWVLEKYLDEVSAPGNSGLPEFKFVINGNQWIDAPKDKVWAFNDHYVIQSSLIKASTLKEYEEKSNYLKLKYNSINELANFRMINSGKLSSNVLYRSYHPFATTCKPNHPREKDRQSAVQKLIKKNKIKNIINLADTGIYDLYNYNSQVPTIYSNLISKDAVLFTSLSYNDVYYRSSSEKFSEELKKILRFMLSTQPPFLVHCHIGTDRTGVVSAVIQGIMGATWEEIARDYQKSNLLGVEEFRSERLLKYSLEQMLNIKINDSTNFESTFKDFIIKNKILTKEELLKLKSNLS